MIRPTQSVKNILPFDLGAHNSNVLKRNNRASGSVESKHELHPRPIAFT